MVGETQCETAFERFRQIACTAAATMALLAAMVEAEPPFPVVAVLSGIAEVKDGDGLLFGDVEVRLQGIAAPEDRRGRVDPGGKDATAALEQLAAGKEVVCYLDGTTAGDSRRPVAICEVDGRDLGQRWSAPATRAIALHTHTVAMPQRNARPAPAHETWPRSIRYQVIADIGRVVGRRDIKLA